MDFNPNIPAKRKEFFWATYIPDRRPEFKMHTKRAHALNAAQYRNNYILYQWVDNEWVERSRLENFYDQKCHYCGYYFEGYQRYGGYSEWIDKDTDFPKRVRVCYECKFKKKV
jgi:hypothetical protein